MSEYLHLSSFGYWFYIGSVTIPGGIIFIVDNMAYASEPAAETEIDGVRIVEDYILIVHFTSGEYRLFDAKTILRFVVQYPYQNIPERK